MNKDIKKAVLDNQKVTVEEGKKVLKTNKEILKKLS